MHMLAVLHQYAEHWPLLAAAAAAIAVHFAIEPLRWRLYLGADARNGNLLAIFWSAAFFSYLFPFKLGLALRFGLLVKKLRQPAAVVTLLMALDGVLYYAVFGLAGLASAVFLGKQLQPPSSIALTLSGILLALLALAFFLRRRKRIPKEPQGPSTAHLLVARLKGLGLLRTGTLALLLLIDLASHVLRHAALFAAMDAPALPLGLLIALPIFSVVAGMFSLMPMGLGGYEAALIAGCVAAGMPAGMAVQVALTNRVLSLAVAFIGGVIATTHLGLDWRRPHAP